MNNATNSMAPATVKELTLEDLKQVSGGGIVRKEVRQESVPVGMRTSERSLTIGNAG